MVRKAPGDWVRAVWSVGNENPTTGFVRIDLVVGGLGEFQGEVIPVATGSRAVQQFWTPPFQFDRSYFSVVVLREVDPSGALIRNMDNEPFTIDVGGDLGF